MLKLHKNLTFSFLKLCTLIDFIFADLDKVVKIALFTYIWMVILKLNNEVIGKWNYFQPITGQEQNLFFVHIGINIAWFLV